MGKCLDFPLVRSGGSSLSYLDSMSQEHHSFPHACPPQQCRVTVPQECPLNYDTCMAPLWCPSLCSLTRSRPPPHSRLQHPQDQGLTSLSQTPRNSAQGSVKVGVGWKRTGWTFLESDAVPGSEGTSQVRPATCSPGLPKVGILELLR